jgi:hypothetical protein
MRVGTKITNFPGLSKNFIFLYSPDVLGTLYCKPSQFKKRVRKVINKGK